MLLVPQSLTVRIQPCITMLCFPEEKAQAVDRMYYTVLCLMKKSPYSPAVLVV